MTLLLSMVYKKYLLGGIAIINIGCITTVLKRPPEYRLGVFLGLLGGLLGPIVIGWPDVSATSSGTLGRGVRPPFIGHTTEFQIMR